MCQSAFIQGVEREATRASSWDLGLTKRFASMHQPPTAAPMVEEKEAKVL